MDKEFVIDVWQFIATVAVKCGPLEAYRDAFTGLLPPPTGFVHPNLIFHISTWNFIQLGTENKTC
jgi:hypothetical protein